MPRHPNGTLLVRQPFAVLGVDELDRTGVQCIRVLDWAVHRGLEAHSSLVLQASATSFTVRPYTFREAYLSGADIQSGDFPFM
jgi:hypothetical protein